MVFDLAFLQHIIAHGVVSLVFLIVGFSILKRKNNRVARTMAVFFLMVGFGLGTCVVLRLNSNPQISALGSYIGYSVTTASLIGLLFFDLLIWKSDSEVSIKKQLLFSLIYWIALLPIAIPNEWTNLTIQYIGDSTVGNPVINLSYFLYAVIMSQSMILLTMIMASRIASRITNPPMKKNSFKQI